MRRRFALARVVMSQRSAEPALLGRSYRAGYRYSRGQVIANQVEERAPLLGIGAARQECQGVRPGAWPSPGEQDRVWNRDVAARLVLPDAGLVKGLGSVDQHLRMAVAAALLAERAQQRDSRAREREARDRKADVVGDDACAAPAARRARERVRSERGRRDLEREPAIGLPRGDGRGRGRSVEEAPERAIRRSR